MPNEFTAFKKYKAMQKPLEEVNVRTYPILKFCRICELEEVERVQEVRREQMQYLQLLCSGSKK